LTIVPNPWLSAMTAFVGLERLTKYVSSGSTWMSPKTRTLNVRVVWPASKVRVPVRAW
jgi:hypothetical protein